MKALVGTFNQEKALVGAFSVIVKTDCETDGSFYSNTALYLTLTLALARSGLSLLLSSWPTNSELAGSSPAAGASSTAPEPPEAAASKAVVLTVMIWRGVTVREVLHISSMLSLTLTGSVDWRVMTALPA